MTPIFVMRGENAMTLEMAEKKFGISMTVLEEYVSYGFLKATEKEECKEYRDQDFEQLGLIENLMRFGLSIKEIKKYISLDNEARSEEQIQMLRRRRKSLLDEIHETQQILDNLDFMVWEKKKHMTNAL